MKRYIIHRLFAALVCLVVPDEASAAHHQLLKGTDNTRHDAVQQDDTLFNQDDDRHHQHEEATRKLIQLPPRKFIYYYGEAFARTGSGAGKWKENIVLQLQKRKNNYTKYFVKTSPTTDVTGTFESFVSTKGGIYRLRILHPDKNIEDLDLVESYAVVPSDNKDSRDKKILKFNTNGYSPPFRANQRDAIYVRAMFVPNNQFRIQGYLWHDANQDGLQDDNELPLKGVVRLSRTLSDPKRTGTQQILVAKTKTNAAGRYGLKAAVARDANYTLSVQLEDSQERNKYAFTRRIVKDFRLLDNDSDVDDDGKVEALTVKNGDDIEIDAGFVDRASLRCVKGYTWRDGGNGWQNDRDSSLDGARVSLEHYSGYPDVVTKGRSSGNYEICTHEPRPANALHAVTISKNKYLPTKQLNPDNFARSGRDSDIDAAGRSLWFLFDDDDQVRINAGFVRSNLLPLGEQCVSDSACLTAYCHMRGSDPIGTCTCNPETNQGCSGDYECASPELIEMAERPISRPSARKLTHPPTCYLPPGAPCTSHGECLTDFCEATTLTCAACNPKTSYPCRSFGRSSCRIIEGSYGCLTCPWHGVRIGDDEVSGDEYECPYPKYRDVNCGGCHYSNQCLAEYASPDFTNATCENVGCPAHVEVEFPDYDSLSQAAFCPHSIAPVECQGCAYANQCIASIADPDFTSETCRPHVSMKDCPIPSESGPETCPAKIIPVVCNGCEYSNICEAKQASATFTEDSCKHVAECPKQSADSAVCARIVQPVDCDGCLYLNQCDAATADPSFTPETCSRVGECPLPDASTNCPAVVEPVRCSGCVYNSMCEATAADSTFTPDTCRRFVYDCPAPRRDESNCSQEAEDVVDCLGCKYLSQCEALYADPELFTPETCKLRDTCPPPYTEVNPSFAACTMDLTPVRCFGCIYNNLCLALSAASRHSPDICRPLECPPPIPFSACPKNDEKPPVSCFGCQYNNMCEAKWAEPHFTEDVCVEE